jgi:hypothetical protein
MAVFQLEVLIVGFEPIATEKVLTAAKDFKAALEEWANA